MLVRTVGSALRRAVLLAVLTTLVGAAVAAGSAEAAPGDIGVQGGSWGNLAGGAGTGNKESKLWYANGSWWAAMFNGATSKHTIHRLDRTAERWVDTGVQIDARSATREDVLW